MNQVIATTKAPSALGPYSQAVKCGNTVYCSGQIGLNPGTGELASGVQNQAKQALSNLKAVLKKAGFAPAEIVKVTIFMTEIANFQLVNQVYGEFFADSKVLPARSAVGIQALPAGALVEIEAIAEKNEKETM